MKTKLTGMAVLGMSLWVFSTGALSVNAQSMNGDCNGSLGEWTVTQEYLELKNRNNAEVEEILADRMAEPYAIAAPTTVTINVEEFEQENGHYCGPATVKQVLNYITGSSLSQGQYAKDLGTTDAGTIMTNIPAVLNMYSGISHEYKYDDITSKSYWGDRIYISIDFGRPAVLDINTEDVEGWPYKTDGHFVNVSGYKKDVSELKEIRITDPYGPGLGNHWYSVDTLYQANENHFRQAFIW